MAKKDIGIALWTIFLLSSNLIVQKIAVEHLPVFVLSFLRVALLFPLLFFYPKPQKNIWQYTVCGFFVFGLYFVLFGFGLQTTIGAGLSAFVCQLQVFFGVIACFFILGEKPTWFQNIGLLVSCIGIYFLQASSTSLEFPLVGMALLIVSCLSVGIGIALSKKYKMGGNIEDITWFSVTAGGPLFLACLFFEGPTETFHHFMNIASVGFLCALYGALISTLWGTYLWLGLINRNPASSVFPFFLLIPIFSNIFANIILGETLSNIQMGAGCIIIFGLLFSQGLHQKIPHVFYWVRKKVRV